MFHFINSSVYLTNSISIIPSYNIILRIYMLLFQPEILVFAVQRNKIILNGRFSLSEAGYTQLSSFIVWIQVTENNPSFFNDTYRHKNKTGA